MVVVRHVDGRGHTHRRLRTCVGILMHGARSGIAGQRRIRRLLLPMAFAIVGRAGRSSPS